MITKSKGLRVAGTLILGLCGLALHGAAHAVAIYTASSSLSLTVTGITGSFLLKQADQFLIQDSVVEQGDGSATNADTLTPGVLGIPLGVGSVITNTASVSGSADTIGSLALSDLQTDLYLYFVGGIGGGTIDLAYTFTGSAIASETGNTEYAKAIASFSLIDNVTGAVINEFDYVADSVLGLPVDGGVRNGTLSLNLGLGISRVLRFNVDASGIAVPAPAPLALVAGCLLAIGAFRRRV